MNNSVILVNQVTGPLFIDIANQYAMHYKNVILITGSDSLGSITQAILLFLSNIKYE